MEVLLVDDQAVTVQVYAAVVRKTFSGARVHIAVDLPDALQIAAGRTLDLVLLDLMLPTSAGIDTLQRFRKACPSIPVLVVAASEDKALIRACLDAGARGYVPKTSALLALAGAMQTVAAGGRHVPPEAQRPDLKPAANGG
jgi:DNA-binding NarL/FixJ family response regulator